MSNRSRSAHEAMQAFDARPFDIILSDLEMPGEDGYSLVQRIRARQAHGRDAFRPSPSRPMEAPTIRARATAAGFDRHIVKPIDLDEIIATVATLGRPSGLSRSWRP